MTKGRGNLNDLSAAVAKRTTFADGHHPDPEEVKAVLNAIAPGVVDLFKAGKHKVNIPHMCAAEVKVRDNLRNPRTGETLPPTMSVKIRPLNNFKASVRELPLDYGD